MCVWDRMDVFSKSDQDQCAQLLFSAYREGRVNEIKHVISTSTIIPHLDHMVCVNYMHYMQMCDYTNYFIYILKIMPTN